MIHKKPEKPKLPSTTQAKKGKHDIDENAAEMADKDRHNIVRVKLHGAADIILNYVVRGPVIIQTMDGNDSIIVYESGPGVLHAEYNKDS